LFIAHGLPRCRTMQPKLTHNNAVEQAEFLTQSSPFETYELVQCSHVSVQVIDGVQAAKDSKEQY
jgi:hypothetical protein